MPRAPGRFRVGCSGWQYLHWKGSFYPTDLAVGLFFERARSLGRKLGPVLYQLPPRWPKNIQRLEEFLAALPKRRRHVFEFREASWYAEDAYRALERAGVVLCLHDMRGSETPERGAGPFVYVRFHGSGKKYGGRYPDPALAKWAKRLAGEVRRGRDVYAYFNNDWGGHAPRDALRLREAIGDELERPRTR